MEDYIDIKTSEYTVIGKNSLIEGELHLSGTTYIAADIKGKIFMEEKSKLILQKAGTIRGDIVCQDIDLYGSFEGSINSNGIVTIFAPGNVTGEIIGKDLVIHPGAKVEIKGETLNAANK